MELTIISLFIIILIMTIRRLTHKYTWVGPYQLRIEFPEKETNTISNDIKLTLVILLLYLSSVYYLGFDILSFKDFKMYYLN